MGKRAGKPTARQRSAYLTILLVEQLKKEINEEAILEYKFHSTRKWRFDIAYKKAKMAIEIQGGVWVYGAHVRPKTYINDCEKLNEAQNDGWMVVYILPADIENGEAAKSIINYYKIKLEREIRDE